MSSLHRHNICLMWVNGKNIYLNEEEKKTMSYVSKVIIKC